MNARPTPFARRLTTWLLAAVATVVAVAPRAAAGPAAFLDPARPLTRLDRRTWNLDHDVFLGTVKAMLQGRDGYLWLGTDAGGGLTRLKLGKFDRLTGRPTGWRTTWFSASWRTTPATSGSTATGASCACPSGSWTISSPVAGPA